MAAFLHSNLMYLVVSSNPAYAGLILDPMAGGLAGGCGVVVDTL